jgi:rhodanese-related sulfurtransferase
MPTSVTNDEVQRLASDGGVVVDVLPAEKYKREHITGAVNIPLEELTPDRVAPLHREQPVIVYCSNFI